MFTYEYFLTLLSSYVNDTKIEYSDDVDWEKILYLSQIHSVQSIVFIAINKLSKKPPFYNKFKEQFLIAVQVSTLQELYMEQVISELTMNNIDHMLMKGYILRNYYPNKEDRSLSDIDFLIDEKNRYKTHKLLLNMGYKFIEEHSGTDVWAYKKGILYLEVHTAIIYHKLFNDFDYINYFKRKVKNKKLISGNTFELTKEDHFIYIIVHIAKHFHNAGIGIRMLLDLVFFINEFGDCLDSDYIKNELSYIKLDKFTNFILCICKKYFNLDVECLEVDSSDITYIMLYIIEHGVFGFNDKNVEGISFKKNGETSIEVFFKKIFPNIEHMRSTYIWFKDGKKYMLPYAWIRRWIYYLTNKEKRISIVSKFAAIVDNSDEIYKHMDILKKVGLKN